MPVDSYSLGLSQTQIRLVRSTQSAAIKYFQRLRLLVHNSTGGASLGSDSINAYLPWSDGCGSRQPRSAVIRCNSAHVPLSPKWSLYVTPHAGQVGSFTSHRLSTHSAGREVVRVWKCSRTLFHLHRFSSHNHATRHTHDTESLRRRKFPLNCFDDEIQSPSTTPRQIGLSRSASSAFF